MMEISIRPVKIQSGVVFARQGVKCQEATASLRKREGCLPSSLPGGDRPARLSSAEDPPGRLHSNATTSHQLVNCRHPSDAGHSSGVTKSRLASMTEKSLAMNDHRGDTTDEVASMHPCSVMICLSRRLCDSQPLWISDQFTLRRVWDGKDYPQTASELKSVIYSILSMV